MRGLSTVTLALAGLAAHALAHSAPPPLSPSSTVARRKTLGFGPDLPHARFQSVDVRTASPVDPSKDPYAVARDFLRPYDDFQAGRTYVIRPDSYTDRSTGVTHVYVRQVIGGIEVTNAHINLNIKDGRVLNFGDSFFAGQTDQNSHVPVHPHADHCAQLSTALHHHRFLLQVPLPSHDRTRVAHGLANLEHIHVSNCANVPAFSVPGELDMDPRRPLLAFLASALPENHPEFSALGDRLEEHASNIIMTPENHLLGDHASLAMSLSNVPGAVSDVKARIVWVQVPTEYGVKLELVHRFEVELEHSWYETTVTTTVPHRIVSVVDWASDSPMPMSIIEDYHLPNLGAFVPPGSVFDTVASAHPKGNGRRLGKALAGKKGFKSYAPTPKKPHVPEFNKASYLVFPFGVNDPVEAAVRKAASHGEPPGGKYPLGYGRDIVKELGDTLASPAGWHTLPCSNDPSNEDDDFTCSESYWRTTKTTWGNNVFAHENWEGRNNWISNERPLAGSVFAYPYSPRPADDEDESMEQAKAHVNATVSQLFYTSNMAHDLFYRYGFTEAAGNFQQFNFERGGEENDAVIANAQDGSGFNNANFMTPPDGTNGRCRMYLWTTDSPYPDGDMEAGIVIHELTHGLSTRLTGGPKNSGCLGWGESGGMGEGWGDYIATSVRSTSTYTDYPMGAWAANRADGIRNYPYSTDTEINPSMYDTLDKPGYWGVHAIGEVWAEMLWVVQQRFIAKYGFSETLFPPVPDADGTLPPNDFYSPQTFNPLTGSSNPLVPKHGNTLLMQLVVNGMKMQPCSPSFFDARAAIIEADKVLTGGENVCDIWEGFAERGLGHDATVVGSTPWGGGVRANGFKVPSQCRSGEPEPEPKPTPGEPDDCSPFDPRCWFKNRSAKWVPRLPWGYNYYN
ncbi:extracellular elastinolytic metallo proteinase [Boletus reticuloceps]|uniref:Extracellular metalloproteinase n=1 Tax=Boletus reticuloceps TaxID=495285 RepID=A0A8I2YJS2_9AGAM|nr:extracellular elastinolytic metallo proteinase [Boletus reticuloceps]